MSRAILELVADLAHRRGVELSPGWADAFQSDDADVSMDDLEKLTGEIGWPRPRYTQEAPGAAQFPLLVYKAEAGWALAEQWEAVGLVRVVVAGQPEVWSIEEHQVTFLTLIFRSRLPRTHPSAPLTSLLMPCGGGNGWSSMLRSRQ